MNHQQKSIVQAKKKLGQHFLVDQGIIERIVDAINPETGDYLLEIGPGLGAITLPVLARTKSLIAVEIDRLIIPVLLKKSKSLGKLKIIEQDVLTVNYQQLMQKNTWRVFGNLPYNISTPILFALSSVKNISEMIFMLQKEVVDRMIALPKDKNYGRLSLMLQYHHDVYSLFDVPPESFNPPPKVMSAMVGLIRLDKPRWSVDDEALFNKVVKQAFSMRRKTIRNNLKSLISSKDLSFLGIDPSLRAEVIDGSRFAKITNYLTTRYKYASNQRYPASY